LLTEEVHRRGIAESVSRELIRIVLHDHDLKPWLEKNVKDARRKFRYRRKKRITFLPGDSSPLSDR
jgi:hypothetical protein